MVEVLENTPENIRLIRRDMRLTQAELAELMGYGTRAWQLKESRDADKARSLTKSEFGYLLLISGKHPDYTLTPRREKDKPAS
ncbi:XRE family transcriptional regulator [Klebsiella michiganensis]|nr:XRE family transcriptional regulator [Klebsiella michiganensis]